MAELRRLVTLFGRLLCGVCEDSEEYALQAAVSSLRFRPEVVRLCLQEALSKKLWLNFDDRVGVSAESDYALLENLCAVVMGVGSRLSEVLGVYDVLLQRCLATETLVTFLEANYLDLLPHLVQHVARDRHMHAALRSVHADVSTVFSRESVYLFENLLLRNARLLAHQMFVRSLEDGRDYSEFAALLSVDSVSSIHLWTSIKMEVAREFIRLDRDCFYANCPVLFEAGPGVMAFLRSTMPTRAFLDALVRYLKRTHALKRMAALVSTYAQFYNLLCDAPEAKALRFVQSPRFLNRLISSQAAAGQVREDVREGVKHMVSCLSADNKAAFLRLYRAQVIKRALSREAVPREEMRLAASFAQFDRRSYSGLLSFLCSVSAAQVRSQTVDCMLVCKYMLPEPIPAAALDVSPDLFPELFCQLTQLRARNADVEFAVSLHFGYAEFEVPTRTGTCVVVGQTAHYVLVARLAQTPASYAELLALMDGSQRLLDATLARLRECGLVRMSTHHFELDAGFESAGPRLVLTAPGAPAAPDAPAKN
ncbi:hypothetical protein EMCLV030L [Equine molluscum contagiosum-like virus]|nr:hypothetical protein EMCLV030L [Equine molluscum contagiosum-like virus]